MPQASTSTAYSPPPFMWVSISTQDIAEKKCVSRVWAKGLLCLQGGRALSFPFSLYTHSAESCKLLSRGQNDINLPHWSFSKQHPSVAFGSPSTSYRKSQLFGSSVSNVSCVPKGWDDFWVYNNQRKKAHCSSWSLYSCLKIEQDFSFCLFLEKMSRLCLAFG